MARAIPQLVWCLPPDGFAASVDLWEQWEVVIAPRASAFPLLVAAALGVGGCANLFGPRSTEVAAVAPGPTAREQEIEDRKQQLLQQLATCESGSWGPQPKPIYGGRGAYHGRFQFTPRTYVTYARRRDGTVLTLKEAAEQAQNYDQAASLAWYMIYELEEPWHWPLCSRKLGIPAQLRQIKQL